jgi:D-arabinose 1-dehydrogenase-like Zn-dependent alcohol dehydrogenase
MRCREITFTVQCSWILFLNALLTPTGGLHDTSVVISGGLGALGSLVGSWAASLGAQQILLLGRSASKSGDAAKSGMAGLLLLDSNLCIATQEGFDIINLVSKHFPALRDTVIYNAKTGNAAKSGDAAKCRP